METIAIVCLILLGVAVLIGGVVLFFALRKARGGVEDDEGFHRTDRTKRGGDGGGAER